MAQGRERARVCVRVCVLAHHLLLGEGGKRRFHASSPDGGRALMWYRYSHTRLSMNPYRRRSLARAVLTIKVPAETRCAHACVRVRVCGMHGREKYETTHPIGVPLPEQRTAG